MSKDDIKNTQVNNDQIPQGVYNTIGKQALVYTKPSGKKDKHK